MVIKPLAEALKSGDRIYSVINDVLINQDGRTQGISLPNGEAQVNMLSSIYKRAQINPCEVHYIEAHGTGTAVGDPIDANAIGSVFSVDRAVDNPCYIGSVKNEYWSHRSRRRYCWIYQGLFAVYHSTIPPNINFNQPNPAIAFDKYNIRVPVNARPWPEIDKQRYVGISSFGFGGVNAHTIIQAPPVNDSPDSLNIEASEVYFFPFSANTAKALHDVLIGSMSI